MIEYELEKLLNLAKSDLKIKAELLKTKTTQNPVEDFCKLAQELGFDVTMGELMAVGQNSNDAKLRSVNGGGVDGIDGWDDVYEQFFLTLEWTC